MADNLYLDFKIYYGLTGFSQNCVYLTSASPSKAAYPRCRTYKQVKRDIQLCKYNMGINASVFELEFCIRVESGNSG